MAEKPIYVFRVEYEKIATMSAWTAFVAAHTVQEAEAYITKMIGPIRVLSAGMQCRFDSLTFEVRDRIVNAYLGKGKDTTKDAKIGDIAEAKTTETEKKTLRPVKK